MKALIVEDSDMIRTDLIEMLRDFDKLSLLQAENGQTALKIFEDENPELVILDLGLPYLSGFEVLRKIKNKKPSAIVVVFTNHSEKYFIDICEKYGADHFFDKSTQFEEFVTTIKKIIC
jgi:DNA-binding NarL/FixJ family response regulator